MKNVGIKNQQFHDQLVALQSSQLKRLFTTTYPIPVSLLHSSYPYPMEDRK